MVFISFLIGIIGGSLGMAILSGNAYEKGWSDAKREEV